MARRETFPLMLEAGGGHAIPEEELALLRQVVDVLPVAVVVYSVSGRVLLANRARTAMIGDPATIGDAIARSQPRHEDGTPIPDDEVPGVRALRGETVMGLRLRLRAADGRDVVALANAAPLHDSGGALTGTVLVLDDITALSELERGRRELFATANHDLRTPLAGILAAVQLARRHVGDAERLRSDLERIERESERMLRLTRDLLDVARFETGRIPVDLSEGDLGAQVRAAIERHDRARVDARLPAEPVRVRFDADRIAQVLDNLLANALRYSAPGTKVEVGVATEKDEVLVRIRDRGRGIAPDERARLFTAFYQTPRGRAYGGTGLGLHISRRIAEAHGGRLFLEESGPTGSTFTLALPLK